MKWYLAVALALVASPSISDNVSEVNVTLSPPNQLVRRGAAPKFTVTINVTRGHQLVMNFVERPDLRYNYAQLNVARNGALVEVPRIILDPGPASPSDYIDLRAGDSLLFEHKGLPFVLSELPAGTYTAWVKFLPDWSESDILSNTVSFSVEAK
jgi:hypothetical protein